MSYRKSLWGYVSTLPCDRPTKQSRFRDTVRSWESSRCSFVSQVNSFMNLHVVRGHPDRCDIIMWHESDDESGSDQHHHHQTTRSWCFLSCDSQSLPCWQQHSRLNLTLQLSPAPGRAGPAWPNHLCDVTTHAVTPIKHQVTSLKLSGPFTVHIVLLAVCLCCRHNQV